jgi:uncharacterized protein
MIESTFILLNGIGEYTERRLWSHGVRRWQNFLDLATVPGISAGRKRLHDDTLCEASRFLSDGNARYFARHLKGRDHWRLFEAFRSRAVYLDIETSGGSALYGEVTVVGLYANGRMTSLVKHDSLTPQRLQEELRQHDLIVTFFGSTFDLPYLKAQFPSLVVDQPHIDLCFAARRLGLRGGLKRIELEVGIESPPDLQGLTGWDAVRLWEASRRGHDPSLELLLRYNQADSRNLERLAERLNGTVTGDPSRVLSGVRFRVPYNRTVEQAGALPFLSSQFYRGTRLSDPGLMPLCEIIEALCQYTCPVGNVVHLRFLCANSTKTHLDGNFSRQTIW